MDKVKCAELIGCDDASSINAQFFQPIGKGAEFQSQQFGDRTDQIDLSARDKNLDEWQMGFELRTGVIS